MSHFDKRIRNRQKQKNKKGNKHEKQNANNGLVADRFDVWSSVVNPNAV